MSTSSNDAILYAGGASSPTRGTPPRWDRTGSRTDRGQSHGRLRSSRLPLPPARTPPHTGRGGCMSIPERAAPVTEQFRIRADGDGVGSVVRSLTASPPAVFAASTIFTASSKLPRWLAESSATTYTGLPGPISRAPIRIVGFGPRIVLIFPGRAGWLPGSRPRAVRGRCPELLPGLARAGAAPDPDHQHPRRVRPDEVLHGVVPDVRRLLGTRAQEEARRGTLHPKVSISRARADRCTRRRPRADPAERLDLASLHGTHPVRHNPQAHPCVAEASQDGDRIAYGTMSGRCHRYR